MNEKQPKIGTQPACDMKLGYNTAATVLKKSKFRKDFISLWVD